MTVPENLAQYDTEENRKAYEALVNGNASSAASTATSQVPDDLAKYDTDENRKAYEAYSKEHAFDNGFTITYNGQTTSYTKEQTDLLKRAYQTLNQNDDFAKSALESYGNNAFDQFAMQNGLPSWKMFSTVQKYAAGGGVAENYGNLSDDQWKKINELWAKDWEYGLSDQDYARKAAGLAPVSYDSMYEDTLLDQELKAKGLPPSKLLNGKLGEAYNTWVKDTNTRNDILQSIANDYVSGKLFFAENPATGKKEAIDYDDADFMTSAILAAQSDPRYSEFFKNHYGEQQELPDEHDPKYIMYTKDPISGEKTPLYDESGSYLYDTNAWMEDRQKIINENTALADDEFAITPDIVKNYITENGLSITADIATEKWFKANDPKFEHATRMANPEYIAKLVDFASAYEFVGEGGVTLASLFPNKQFTLAERTELQPLIDKINTRALEQGMSVYEEYFKGGEWARDVHQIENNNIVAQYRENNADVDGYNDVGSKNYHSDDKILNEHYETLAKEYGIDKEMPLTDAVAKLRSGEMTIDAYLTDKCKTPEDAEAFAKMRYENYCKANNLPTTEKGWEENRELRSAAHDYINNELGDQQQDMLDTPESEWQNQHDVWGNIASKYKTKAEALKAQQNGAMPQYPDFDSVVDEWEYAVEHDAKAMEALDIYAHIHELDPTWNNESARYEQQQYGTPVQESANAVRLSYLGESLSYAYKNVNIDNVEQRARQLFEDKAGIGMSSGLVLKSGALGAAGVLAGAPLPVGSAIAGALLSDSDKRKNMDALYDELTEEEKQKLVYMSMQYGTDSDNVKDYINSVLLSAADRRRRQEQQAENGYWFSESDSATMRIFGGTANTLASALFIQPTESLANFISDTINIKTGNELLSSMRSNLGQDNISNIASNITEKAGKGWAFAYQLAPSMIQSVNQAVAAYLTKGASEIPTLISMAMQSYSSAVDDALQRGVSSKEAYYYGIMNGVAEYVFEKVSLDKFLSESNEALDTIIALKRAAKRSGTKAVVDRKLFAKAWLTILKNAPIQGLVEMSEETWTSLANYLSETALLSVDSTFDKYVEHYMAGGMSQEDAEKKAKEDVAKEIFGEGAAGFISGMLMSGGRSVMMMTSAAGTVHIDRTGMSEFLNATHNLSTISAVEAGNYVRTRLDLSGNTQITARQVASVMNELIRKGADAATLMRVRNEILAAKPSAAVGTVMNNIISEQSRNDAKRLINAAQRYITRTNKNGKTNISPEAIATVTNEYLSALQTRAQDRDVRNIQYATERIRSEYIANIASKTGVSQTASGMSALNEYFTALPQASQAAIQKDAEKYKVKFNGTGMTETDAAQYALYASILHDACTEANSTGAYSVLFGESAAYTPMAIENACLNSTGEEAAIFIDSVCDAIAALNGSTGTLTTAAMNGSNATAFAATQMAIARESSNVRAKAVYDYIVKHGASSDLMDMLTAANMLESLSPVERFALMSSIRVTGNNMMTNVQLDDIVGTYTKARENYEGQKRVMEEHQKSDAQKVIDEDARIAMYDTQIATLDAQIEAETDPKLKGTLMEKRADNAKARQDAITAKEEETRRRAERMASTQKELNSAKSSADKAQNDYNRSMRRHAAQYVQRMGDIYQGIMAHDHLSLVSIASKAAAVKYGDAKNLNDVQEIIRASEKASAVALGRMMGVTVEVVEFSEKFFDEKNVPKEYRKPNAPGVTIDGKVYLNEKSITAEVGSGTNAVILHEIGHVMEASADNYAKYAKFARQYFETRDGKESVDRWIASLVESGMTEENANKELVAEFTRQVALADPRAIRALTKSAPIMSMRIFQWLTNMKSALTPQALEQATTLRDAQLAFARAMKTVKKSGSEVSSVYDVAVNRAAIDNANETLDERARLEEQAKQTKTEQKTETPTATDEQQTVAEETPAEPAEETTTQPATEETEQTVEPIEETPAEVAEETVEETKAEEQIEEQTAEEPQEDFADIEDEVTIDTSSKTEYNNNEVNANASEETAEGRVRSALQGNEGHVQYDDGQRAEADARADSERVEVSQPEGDRGLSQNGLDRRDNRGENLRLLNDHREAFQKKDSGHFEMKETDDHQRFSDALSNMRENNIEGASVDPKSVDELSGMTTLLTDDNSAGVAVAPNGNITGLFKNRKINSNKNAGIDLMFAAIAIGGDRCDCYGPFLANTYANAGMVPVARVQYARGFNPEMDAYIDEMRAKGKAGFETDPDIYFMRVQPGMSFEDLVNAYESGDTKQYTKEELDALPLFEDSDGEYGYDRAEAYRDALLEKDNGSAAKGAQYYTEYNPEYLDLARRYESGDKSVEADLRKAVDAAAKRAGYSIKAFHGTTENFNVFSRKQQGVNHKGYLEFGAGFYFTPSETEAEQWVKRGRSGQDGKAPIVMSVYLNPMRMLSADESVPGGAKYLRTWLSQGEAEFIAARTYRFINYLIEDKGFSNVEAQETLKALGYDAIEATFKNGTEGQYVVFDPSQIKSADLITKDDSGNIIPLSERFKTDRTGEDAWKNEDIRYYTEYNPQALAVQRNIDDMTDMEKSASGNPRMLQTENGYAVVRTFTKNGFTSGNPMANGNGLQNIAMIAPVAAFENGFVDRAVPASKCTAVVIPNTDEYADMRTDARDAGAYVYGYDPSDPSMLDRAIDRAKDAQSVQYMPQMRYEDFIEKYGAHPYGTEPRVKNRPVPRQTTDTNRVSRMASNAATSPLTTDQGYEDIQGWIADHGTGTFTPQSNNRVLNRARGVIERAGDIHQAAADLDRDVANGIGKATDLLAIAELLYAQTQDPNSGLSVIEREKIFGNLCIIASDAGRALQLASRLKYMTPEGHIAYIEQVGKRIADKYEKRTGKRTVLKPTQEEIDAYKGAQTVEEMEEIDKKVSERFGEETSDLTWIDRVRNWRYFSMLGNPRTHFRNIVGNALMNPVARVKDSINSIYQLGMDKSDRTTAFVTKRADANTREFVNQMLEENLPRMQGVSEKYMEGVDNQSIRTIGQAWKTDVKSAALTKGRTAFGRALNRLSSFNSNMLELEDAKALSRRFRSAMYQIIQARGIDVSNITEQQKSDIVNYAMEESLRATFRDASALADALNKFANTNKATRLAMEAIVPFKRTPINIAKRSVEYSPIGLVNGLYKLFSANRAYNTDIKNIESMQGITDEERAAMRENAENTLKQNKIRAIDRLAAGTTGSLMTLIGMFASAMGWISIGRKDDEEAAFEQGLGKNTYSLNIGDLSIDLSAFSPAAVPLLMGTALYQAVGAEHDENFVSSMISVLAESVDPVTEMSMLSGIADALSSTSYGNEEGRNTRWFGAIAGNALESYVGQFVPTFVGQVNRTIDPYARSYTAGDDYWATKAFGSEIGSSVKSIQNKVFPWLSEPKVNIHGEEQRNYTNFGSLVRNFANNTLLPATIKVDQKNEIDDELIRLYGVVDSADLFPTKPSRNLGSYDNTPIKITSDSEYMQYQMEYGQTVYDMLEDLMSSPAYRMMTDTQKADAVERIIDQAKSATKKRWKAQKVANMK